MYACGGSMLFLGELTSVIQIQAFLVIGFDVKLISHYL